ncbi:MAG: formimidoylglutamase, partial [Anaerolineae bacterium]|nr:formimidoylglutamase [Anaerolineae bacterium]
MLSLDELFQVTQRPDTALLYHRNDMNDARLGEIVQTDPTAYGDAEVVILGCPQDEGVRRNGGRIGAALAPTEIRRCFYKLTVNGVETLRLFDLGNTLIQATLEETHRLQQEIVARVIADGKMLIVLGGGNDCSYPDCSGLAQAVGRVLAFNVDAHYDVRADAVCNSGTPYRQLLESGSVEPDDFYEVGSQPFANSPIYGRYLQDKGAHIIPLKTLRASGNIRQPFEAILNPHPASAIFWGLDMDVVRAADAPGVSAPNPVGMSGEELCEIAAVAGRATRSRLLEITEVNPTHDIDQRTCRLAAVVIHTFLSARQEI